jgi:hypothetical protein
VPIGSNKNLGAIFYLSIIEWHALLTKRIRYGLQLPLVALRSADESSVGRLPDLYGEGDKTWEKEQILSHNQVVRVG